MLEQLRQEIEALSPEAQNVLFQFIQVLKNNDAHNPMGPDTTAPIPYRTQTFKTLLQQAKPLASETNLDDWKWTALKEKYHLPE